MNNETVTRNRQIAHSICDQRKEMVMRHPDIARRLVTELGYAGPGQWNGFIPPSHFNGSPNNSPRRVALLEIEADAWNADREAEDKAQAAREGHAA